MINVNKPVHIPIYLNNNNNHESTNLNKLDEIDEISQSDGVRSNQPSEQASSQTDSQSKGHLNKLGKMFRKLSHLSKPVKHGKQCDKSSKLEVQRPLITVIHKTVTKNNVKLFAIDGEDANSDLSNERSINNSNCAIEFQHCAVNQSNNLSIYLPISHNRSDSSMNHSTKSNDHYLGKEHFNESNLSSLPIEHSSSLTNRKIEDVRSRSETKLTNCPRRQPAKMKSESFYFLESQSKNLTVHNHSSNGSSEYGHPHLSSKLYKKHLKNSREQEKLNFQTKKLIAESLVKSNRSSEMNALLTSEPSKPASSSNLHTSELNGASHKIPSYIGISCAISGYSTYSKYIASESNSPSVKRLNDTTLLHNTTSPHNSSLHSNLPTKSNGPFLDVDNTIESYYSFKNNLNRFNKLDNGVNRQTNHPSKIQLNINHHNTHSVYTASNHLNYSNQYDSLDNSFLTKDRTLLNDSSLSKEEDDNKSLVQKRIESLYGHNFASNWRKDRFDRSKIRNEKSNNDSFRSPSCPPEFITNGLIPSKKNLPVLKYIQNTIFNNSDHNDLKKDTKPTEKQTKSEEVISFQSDGDDLSLKEQLVSSNDLNEKLEIVQESDLLMSTKGDKLIPEEQNDLVPSDKSNDLMSNEDNLLEPENIQIGTDEIDNIDLSQVLCKDEKENCGGRYYLKKLENEIRKINDKISLIEVIGVDENVNNKEEIEGKIRASVGKAHLLINKKLNQFKELCNKNINQTPDEQYKTLNEDLEGFYEMVSYQIDDIHKTFDEILFLKNNNWIVHNDLLNASPRKATNSKSSSRTNSNANSRNNSKPSSRNTSKEDLRRLKLREAKKKHQQQVTSDDIVIFLTNNKVESKSDVL